MVIPAGNVSEAASTLKVKAPKSVAVNCTITIKTNVKAKFSTSNKKIATVNSKGVVKGKKAGTAKITVTSKSNKNQKKTVKITVKNQLVITAPKESKATLYVGETVKIKTNLSSKYSSSNEDIATVNSSGKVTAKSAGTAKITVTSKSNKKLKKTVTITVQEKPQTTTEQPTTQKQDATDTNTTEKDTSNQNTTEQNTTETTTEQQTPGTITPNPGTSGPTTGDVNAGSTTEQPSTGGSTTEKPTTEEPSTEERYIVGIEASYRGDKVPKNYLNYVNIYGIDIYFIYNDKTTEKIEYRYDYRNDIDVDFNPKIEEKDEKLYATYTISYKEFSTQFTVELIDIGDTEIYTELSIEWDTKQVIKKDEIEPSDILSVIKTARVQISASTEWRYISKEEIANNIYYSLYYEDSGRNEYTAIYDYWFEYNGEMVYICIWGDLYVRYE